MVTGYLYSLNLQPIFGITIKLPTCSKWIEKMVIEINKQDIIVLCFVNEETNETKEVGNKLEDFLKYNEEDLLEFLEELTPCTSSGCYNESQNHCDCGGIYENFEIKKLKFKI